MSQAKRVMSRPDSPHSEEFRCLKCKMTFRHSVFLKETVKCPYCGTDKVRVSREREEGDFSLVPGILGFIFFGIGAIVFFHPPTIILTLEAGVIGFLVFSWFYIPSAIFSKNHARPSTPWQDTPRPEAQAAELSSF